MDNNEFEWKCPDCGGTAFEVLMGHKTPWSMEPCCLACGAIGKDQHFTAEENSDESPIPLDKKRNDEMPGDAGADQEPPDLWDADPTDCLDLGS